MDQEPTPLEMAETAQDLSRQTYERLNFSSWVVLLAAIWPVIAVLKREGSPEAIRNWQLVGSGLLVLAYFLIRRGRARLYELRLKLNQLYRFHKSRASETCGSMDPHFTRARE